MNKKLLSIMCLLSMATVSACQDNTTSSQSLNNNSSSKTSQTTSSSSLSSASSSSSSSSSNNDDNTGSDTNPGGDTVVEEEQYIADSAKRVTVTLNVSLPESENDVYVIGDFNNWGGFHTLNDTSYRVVDGTVSISNVEQDVEYSYMFVQKIAGATYTYNFGASALDSEENHIIGYTKDGELISQYCISQLDERFTFVAQNGESFDSVVSEWKAPIYGNIVEIIDPNKSTELPTSGFNLSILEYGKELPYYVPLENTGTMDYEGRQQYVAYNLTIPARTSITLFDGNSGVAWIEDSLEPYGAHNNFAVSAKNGIVCIAEGTYDIYVKLQAGNDTIYICEAGEVNDSLPMSGYGLQVTSADGEIRYIALEKFEDFTNGEKDENGNDKVWQQYKGSRVQLYAGDVIKAYDYGSQVAWPEKALDEYSAEGCFEVVADGIACKQDGLYDIYLKIRWEDNMIYIGKSA